MSIGIAWGGVEKISDSLYRLDMETGLFALRAVEGVEKLVYEVLYAMFTTRGSIADRPDVGSLLNMYLGLLVSDAKANMDKARTAIGLEVIRVQDQIKEHQKDASIPDSEKLGSIVLDEIKVNPGTSSIELRILIVNILGQAAGVEIPKTLQS